MTTTGRTTPAELLHAPRDVGRVGRVLLEAVERRGSADFGKVEGVIEFALGQMGPMKLETPMIFKMTMNVDGCIDGTLPDAVMGMTAEMKGMSVVTGPTGKIEVTFEMSASAKTTVRTVNKPARLDAHLRRRD
jgi:hypothetical protein